MRNKAARTGTVKHIKLGRPATGRKTPAEYQAERRRRMAKYGIRELRGVRVSETELNMLNELVVCLGYQDRGELIMTNMRKLADEHGISYLATTEQQEKRDVC